MQSDSFWKEVLEKFFAEFLHFFFPQIHHDIDFNKGYRFLDKEFQKISKEAETGKKIVDKLVQVYLNDGSEKWLLIHIEIQAQKEKEFAKRMFTYNYRIFDRYQKETISLALLTDPDTHYRPNQFQIKRWGFECLFKFPLVKIIDYINYNFESERRSNPFALLVQAYLKTIETQGDDQSRYRWKKEFITQIYQTGISKETLYQIYQFIEWIMELPKELDEKLYYEIKSIKEHKEMSVLSIAEEKGIEKGIQKGIRRGIQKGRQEGEINGIRKSIEILMNARFGKVSKNLIDKISEIDSIKRLEQILLEVNQSVDFNDFEKRLTEKHLI